MRRRFTLALLGGLLAIGGLVAGFLAPKGDAKPAAAAPVNITVTATEFKFKLSKTTVPAGSTVVFTVVNKGKIPHDFKIAGKKTPTIQPGKSAKLTVVLAKKGKSPFICTLPGHAAGGMKGTFGVGVTVTVTTTTTTTTTTTPVTTPVTTPSGPEKLIGDPVAGKAVFAANGCGACHTLKAAGATGPILDLDARKPSQGVVRSTVQSGTTAGGNSMPAFTLSDTDLNDIAAFVYASTH